MNVQIKHLSLNKILCCFVALITSIGSINVLADNVVIVADEWMPYNGPADGQELGYGVELIKKIFEDKGHTVTYKNVPWSRAIQDTRDGKYTAIIGAEVSEAPDFIYPEEIYGSSQVSFYVKKGSNWTFSKLEDLKTLNIGVVEGYSYGEELDQFFSENPEHLQRMTGDNPEVQNLQKLLAGRFDVLVAYNVVADYNIKKLSLEDKIVHAGTIGLPVKLYVGFSPMNAQSKEYVKIYSEGINKLHASGELAALLKKYEVKNWKQ